MNTYSCVFPHTVSSLKPIMSFNGLGNQYNQLIVSI